MASTWDENMLRNLFLVAHSFFQTFGKMFASRNRELRGQVPYHIFAPIYLCYFNLNFCLYNYLYICVILI